MVLKFPRKVCKNPRIKWKAFNAKKKSFCKFPKPFNAKTPGDKFFENSGMLREVFLFHSSEHTWKYRSIRSVRFEEFKPEVLVDPLRAQFLKEMHTGNKLKRQQQQLVTWMNALKIYSSCSTYSYHVESVPSFNSVVIQTMFSDHVNTTDLTLAVIILHAENLTWVSQ